MPRYAVEVLYHEEKDETYTLEVDAADAETAAQRIVEYINAQVDCHPGNLLGRCLGVMDCTFEQEEDCHTFATVQSVVSLPDSADPRQTTLF